jgi:hypothetical protein
MKIKSIDFSLQTEKHDLTIIHLDNGATIKLWEGDRMTVSSFVQPTVTPHNSPSEKWLATAGYEDSLL